jgi:trehalose/maltose transport system substrate-binding protein
MSKKVMPKKGLIAAIIGLILVVGFYIFTRQSADHAGGSDGDVIHITCGMVGLEFKTCQEGVALWEKKTGKKAKVLPAPNGSTERLTLFQQHLAAGSDNIDIYQLDVVWPGLLANHFEDLNDYIPQDERRQYFPQLMENNTVNGKLVAMPWFIQVGFLYYRKDLLEKYHRPVPTTWEALEETATLIMDGQTKEGNSLWGYVFQGKAYEGLTCNALEWIHSQKDGGTIVEADGRVSINNPAATQIVDRIASWMGRIVPEGVLNYEQEDCRGVFQSGKALFMRNWPYAWGLLNSDDSPVKGKVGIAPLPCGINGKTTGALGGWNLGLSKYSKHKKDAADLIRFLTSNEELKRRSQAGGYFPPMEKLYQDGAVLSSNPLMKAMGLVLKNAALRPARQTRSKYSQVSSAFWNAVHHVLSKKITAEKSFQEADKKLNGLSQNGTKWV